MLLYRHNEHVDRPVGGRRGALLTISRGNASSSSSSSTRSLDSASFTSEQQSTNLFAKLEICVKRKCRFRAGRSVVVSARPLAAEVLAPFLLSLFFDFSTNLKTPLPSHRNFLLVYRPVHTIPARIYYLPRPRFLSGPSVAATTTIVSRKTRDKGEEGRERRSRYR